MLGASPRFIFVGALDLYAALPTVSEEQQPLPPRQLRKECSKWTGEGREMREGCA